MKPGSRKLYQLVRGAVSRAEEKQGTVSGADGLNCAGCRSLQTVASPARERIGGGERTPRADAGASALRVSRASESKGRLHDPACARAKSQQYLLVADDTISFAGG